MTAVDLAMKRSGRQPPQTAGGQNNSSQLRRGPGLPQKENEASVEPEKLPPPKPVLTAFTGALASGDRNSKDANMLNTSGSGPAWRKHPAMSSAPAPESGNKDCSAEEMKFAAGNNRSTEQGRGNSFKTSTSRKKGKLLGSFATPDCGGSSASSQGEAVRSVAQSTADDETEVKDLCAAATPVPDSLAVVIKPETNGPPSAAAVGSGPSTGSSDSHADTTAALPPGASSSGAPSSAPSTPSGVSLSVALSGLSALSGPSVKVNSAPQGRQDAGPPTRAWQLLEVDSIHENRRKPARKGPAGVAESFPGLDEAVSLMSQQEKEEARRKIKFARGTSSIAPVNTEPTPNKREFAAAGLSGTLSHMRPVRWADVHDIEEDDDEEDDDDETGPPPLRGGPIQRSGPGSDYHSTPLPRGPHRGAGRNRYNERQGNQQQTDPARQGHASVGQPQLQPADASGGPSRDKENQTGGVLSQFDGRGANHVPVALGPMSLKGGRLPRLRPLTQWAQPSPPRDEESVGGPAGYENHSNPMQRPGNDRGGRFMDDGNRDRDTGQVQRDDGAPNSEMRIGRDAAFRRGAQGPPNRLDFEFRRGSPPDRYNNNQTYPRNNQRQDRGGNSNKLGATSTFYGDTDTRSSADTTRRPNDKSSGPNDGNKVRRAASPGDATETWRRRDRPPQDYDFPGPSNGAREGNELQSLTSQGLLPVPPVYARFQGYRQGAQTKPVGNGSASLNRDATYNARIRGYQGSDGALSMAVSPPINSRAAALQDDFCPPPPPPQQYSQRHISQQSNFQRPLQNIPPQGFVPPPIPANLDVVGRDSFGRSTIPSNYSPATGTLAPGAYVAPNFGPPFSAGHRGVPAYPNTNPMVGNSTALYSAGHTSYCSAPALFQNENRLPTEHLYSPQNFAKDARDRDSSLGLSNQQQQQRQRHRLQYYNQKPSELQHQHQQQQQQFRENCPSASHGGLSTPTSISQSSRSDTAGWGEWPRYEDTEMRYIDYYYRPTFLSNEQMENGYGNSSEFNHRSEPKLKPNFRPVEYGAGNRSDYLSWRQP